jgi:hypothetical protein
VRSAPSLPQTSRFPLHPGLLPGTHLKETPRGSSPVRATRIGQMTERRRRDRFIAWGVSPRYRLSQYPEAPEMGRQIAIVASAAIFLLSVAASRLEDLFPCRVPGVTDGLRPSCRTLAWLRSMPDSLPRFRLDSPASRARVDAPGYGYAAASRLRVSGFALWASPRQVTLRHDKSRLVRAITKKRGEFLERTG